MACNRFAINDGLLKRVCLSGVSVPVLMAAVRAEPLPLPYRARPPYLPMIDIFGGPRKGLEISAYEVFTGRPVPVTVGNATFVPEVRRAGQKYGGYTRFNGDLQIVNGDLYLEGRAVGQSLYQLQANDSRQEGQLRSQGGSIRELAGDMVRNEQATERMGIAVSRLGQVSINHASSLQQHSVALKQHSVTLRQHSVTLQQHALAINNLAADVDHSRQEIAALDQNLNRLGSGVSGATALAAALGSLPVESHGSPVACGVGTGGYSGRFALATGCAVRLGSALSLNAGGSYLFGGSTNYGGGTLSNLAGRIGLVYRFGSSGGANASDVTASQMLNQRLQQQLRLAEQRQQEMATDLRDLQRRLAQLESVAVLR